MPTKRQITCLTLTDGVEVILEPSLVLFFFLGGGGVVFARFCRWKKHFIELFQKHTKLYLSLGFILKIFSKFRQFQPWYSYLF